MLNATNRANQAVDAVIDNITTMRLGDPSRLDRIVFCFPRVRTEWSDNWTDSSPLLAATCAVARNPGTAVKQPPPIKNIGLGHAIPSVIVRLTGVEATEHHVSRKNMERLLSVGCVVIQKDRKGFFVRIPYNSPAYHGQPYQFDIGL